MYSDYIIVCLIDFFKQNPILVLAHKFIHITAVASNFCHANYLGLESALKSHSEQKCKRTLTHNSNSNFCHFKIVSPCKTLFVFFVI